MESWDQADKGLGVKRNLIGSKSPVLIDVIIYPNERKNYPYRIDTDIKFLRKINKLIKECQRTPCEGNSKPDLNKNELTG